MSQPVKGLKGAKAELPVSAALRASRMALVQVGWLSALLNLLMLTSSIFMMQVYDRVLGSRSVATLIALAFLAFGAYAVQWLFDVLRQRLIGLVGEKIEAELVEPVQRGVVELQLRGVRTSLESLQLFRDLDAIRAFAGGAGILAFFDLPWIPIYLVVAYLLHPWLAGLTVIGALILLALTVGTELMSRHSTSKALTVASMRNQLAEQAQKGAEVLRVLGMEKAIWGRWGVAQGMYTLEQRRSSHTLGLLSSLAKSLRYVLQSAVLGLGAYLVIQGQMSGGAIIAASILSGRALAPIDLAIASWRPFVAARQAYRRLQKVLPEFLEKPERMALPAPVSSFELQGIDVAVPGTSTVVVRNVSFKLKAGDALGIIGHSASGKSSLARTMVGSWPPARGRILLDGASLDNFDPGALGPSIGYLPQDVQLFDGTIAENICRFENEAQPDKIIGAAKSASFHDFVLRFPDGYDTKVGPGGSYLSGGQKQRLGLARALYGDPFFVVLDEPNANLDADGEQAVSNAIKMVRERGGVVIVIAHRPSAIAHANLLTVLANGQVAAHGPRDEVLAKTVKNAARIVPASIPTTMTGT